MVVLMSPSFLIAYFVKTNNTIFREETFLPNRIFAVISDCVLGQNQGNSDVEITLSTYPSINASSERRDYFL